MPHIGQPVGKEGARGDVWGDKVTCAKLPFDTWRHRHDDVQLALMERADHARVQMDIEVFWLFRDLVPAAVLQQGGYLEMVRQRQGKVPDLSYHLPTTPSNPPPPPDGQPVPPRRQQAAQLRRQGVATKQLAEIKIIGAGLVDTPGAAGTRQWTSGQGSYQVSTGIPLIRWTGITMGP